MKEKVCYILGAGFSRPLGLPLMSDFLEKAKDMYFNDPYSFAHFEGVLKRFGEYARIQTFLRSEQWNIEELLSLVEMDDYLIGTRNTKKIQRFIADVINHYTPPYDEKYLGQWTDYIAFVAQLVGHSNLNEFEYSVVTLNYDLVLENALHYLYSTGTKLAQPFRHQRGTGDFTISKLHGCLKDPSLIVSPTWNKSRGSELTEQWKIGYKSISTANHIRIVGYSLPESDAYMKYFLKIALQNIEHLKNIDVVCLDDNYGSVKKRYDNFIRFHKYRFVNLKTENYLRCFYSNVHLNGEGAIVFNRLSDGHNVAIG